MVQKNDNDGRKESKGGLVVVRHGSSRFGRIWGKIQKFHRKHGKVINDVLLCLDLTDLISDTLYLVSLLQSTFRSSTVSIII